MRTTDLTKDTALCISLAGRPSSIGTRFHNFLYGELGLDFVYKAFTTTDIAAAIGGVRALGIRGCAVSMPFKEAVIPLLDSVDDSAARIDSVNTIVNGGGRLRGYNTDYIAVAALLSEHGVDPAMPFAVVGSGGMAKAVVAALRAGGFRQGLVVARNRTAGTALAAKYGFTWQPTLTQERPALLVNATPIGMAGGPEAEDLPVDTEVVDAAAHLMDVVAVPETTPLVGRARRNGTPVITGGRIMALQAAEQFALYTGVRPTAEQVGRAAAFSRST